MKRNFAVALVAAGFAFAPLAAYSANTVSENMSSAKESVKEKFDDAKITSKIKATFAKDKAVSAMKIHVRTDNGVVKLSGRAKSQAEADQAVTLAQNTAGVSSVQNEIQVGTTDTSKKAGIKQTGRDAMITSKIKAKFAKDSEVSAMKIHVKTKNGVVRLTGKAKSMEEVNKAIELAQNTQGVMSVQNGLQVEATGATR